MKNLIGTLCLILLFISCQKDDLNNPQLTSNATLSTVATKPAHIVYIWLENHGYNSIVGSANAPYINSLITKGTLFTNAHAVTHPSQPNYMAFFAGAIRVSDNTCISTLFQDKLDMGHQLYPLKFAWYNEGLPSVGSHVCSSGYYVRKHNPIASWGNISPSYNQPFTAFPTDFNLLPPVSCVTPNLQNDMHDGSIAVGDAWVKSKFSKLIDWAMLNNTLVVIYFDESETTDATNKIPVIFLGQHIKANLKIATSYNHYSFAKMTLSLFGKPSTWTTNLSAAQIPTGFWQ